jgi:adenylyltransferase/sulfurtransferase
MVSVFNFQGGPTYRCLFPEQPDSSSIPSCAEAGVLGVLPGIIGCMQAMEAIKVITGRGQPLSGKVLSYNSLSNSTRIINLQALPQSREIKELPNSYEPSCSDSSQKICLNKKVVEISEHELREMMAEKKDLQILDVREDWERMQSRIDPSLHQPLGALVNSVPVSTLDCLIPEKEIVVYCKAGVRSRMACEALQSIGFNHLYNLSSGMDGWMNTFPELTHRG